MTAPTFYTSPSNELEVRSNIVLKYFQKWANYTIKKIESEQLEEKFAFVDLCAAWKKADHQIAIGTKVLQFAVKNTTLRNMLTTVFNDCDTTAIADLTGEWTAIDLIETLHFAPSINYSDVDDNLKHHLATIQSLPMLILIDLWNYEGIDLSFIQTLVKQKKADCLLTFDYQSILQKINKKGNANQIERIFGKKRAQLLQEKLKKTRSAYKKEQWILKAFLETLQKKLGKKIPQPLHFKFFDSKNKTSHYLFFITQNEYAYTLMREILCQESQIIEDGIGNLSYNPNKGKQLHISSPTLFGSMFHLEQELLSTYRSQTLQLIDLYTNHNWGRSLIKKNYIDALLNLEKKNKVTITRKLNRHLAFQRPNHINDNVFVSFNKEVG